MRPYDCVILTEDLNDTLRVGTEGTIVEIYPATRDVMLVEFFDHEGNTIGVVDVHTHQMILTLADFFAGESVALLADIPGHGLVRGQVGTIHERVGVGLYTVEFANASGSLPLRLTLHAGQMLLLQWHPDASRQTA